MRLHVSLKDVPSEVRCAKRDCNVASHARLQRHHKAHPKMFFGVWGRRRGGEEKFQTFIDRYNQFLPEDVVLICDSHHAEIHSIYDRIIAEDKVLTGLPLAKYSWIQAERLMAKLVQTCNEWLKRATTGIDSGSFGETRGIYKALLKQQARRQGKKKRPT